MNAVVNFLLPIFAVIALGGVLKRIGLTGAEFIRTADKLVYYVFLPLMIFWKLGRPGLETGQGWSLYLSVLAAIGITYLASLGWVKLTRLEPGRIGSFSQVSYRFNTYLGLAVVAGLTGEEGLRLFGVLIGLAIPLINLLCVSTLIWYSGQSYSLGSRAALLAKSIAFNPLVVACALGVAYSRLGLGFPEAADNFCGLLASLSLPLALLSIGGSLSFDRLRGQARRALEASLFKLLCLPLCGWALLTLAGIEGRALAVAMIYFALPPSPASYILSSQLGSDVDLASAAVVLSHLLSLISLSAAVLLFASPLSF